MVSKRNAILVSLLVALFVIFSLPTLAQMYKESPMTLKMVNAGQLPPVDQRLPENPFVATPPTIGKYGGTVRFNDRDISPAVDMQSWTRAIGWFRQNADGSQIVPDIAESMTLVDNLSTLIVKIRKGHRWSDGVPFTADDVMFWWEDVEINKDYKPRPRSNLAPEGIPAKFVKVDDYTVRVEFHTSYPRIIDSIMRSGVGKWFYPKHAMTKYHIDYNSKANDIAKEEGFENWRQLFGKHQSKGWNIQEDGDVPTFGAWMTSELTTDTKVMVRNPYFHWVDTEGNQLPYIDRLTNVIAHDQEVHNLKILSGEVDVATFALVIQDFPLFKANEDKGGYNAVLARTLRGSEIGLFPNLTTKDMALRKIFRDLRFRQALSVAIDREEVNDLIFFGEAIPRQATILPGTTFFKKEWAEHYAQHDPALANRLLDEMGLTQRDSEGFRLRPDGKRMSIVIDYQDEEGPKTEMLEVIVRHWKVVGVELLLKPQTHSSFYNLVNANDFEMGGFHLDRSLEGFGIRGHDPYPWYPLAPEYITGVAWRQWILSNGTEGEKPPQNILDWMDDWEDWFLTELGTPEYERLGRKVFDFFSEELHVIGLVGLAPWPQIYSKKLRNVPEDRYWGSDIGFFSAYRTPQFWIEE